MCYNRYRLRTCEESNTFTQSEAHGAATPGALLCLLALAVAVKPLADAVAKYTCCDGHKDFREDFQHTHLLSVARLEKGSMVSIT